MVVPVNVKQLVSIVIKDHGQMLKIRSISKIDNSLRWVALAVLLKNSNSKRMMRIRLIY